VGPMIAKLRVEMKAPPLGADNQAVIETVP